jgi:hypothetical protein
MAKFGHTRPNVHLQTTPQVGSPGMAGSEIASSGLQMSQALGVRTTRFLGVAYIISGLVMVILQIICTILVIQLNLYGAHTGGSGIWCGVFVIICGILGSCAASYKTNALVISFLVFNVLCTIFFALIPIFMTAVDLANAPFCRYAGNNHYDCSYNRVLLPLTLLLLIDAIFIFGISIMGIVTNSVALKKSKGCCCCKRSHEQPPIVIHVPTNQMPGVIGQPLQYVNYPRQVDPVDLQSGAFQVPSAPAGTAGASNPAYSAPAFGFKPAYAAGTSTSAPAYTGATSEPPPYNEKM